MLPPLVAQPVVRSLLWDNKHGQFLGHHVEIAFRRFLVASLFCFAGTTCLIALLSDKDLTVANVGDSRGVLCDKDGNAIPLSHDHKPYQLKERKRIKRAGELISASKDCVLSCSSGQGGWERHSFTQ